MSVGVSTVVVATVVPFTTMFIAGADIIIGQCRSGRRADGVLDKPRKRKVTIEGAGGYCAQSGLNSLQRQPHR